MDIVLHEGEHMDIVNDDISLIQNRSGLMFGTDALLLAGYIKAQPKAMALELGGGSGIISLLLAARNKAAHIDCVELQKTFADIIRRNAALNSLDDKVSCVECDIRRLREHLPLESYDMVFSNPPYMRDGAGKSNECELKDIARHEKNGTIDDFVACAAAHLKYGGKFYCVYRPDRMAELFAALNKYKLEPKRLTLVHAREDSEPSMLLIMAAKGGKSSLSVTAPLILYRSGSNEFTEPVKYIYDNGSFKE